MTTRVYIEETAYPGKYSVRKDSPTGMLLEASSRTPLLDACRALQAQQLGGRVEMWDAVRPYPRMSCDIAAGAKLRIIEAESGLRFAKSVPFIRDGNVIYERESPNG